MPTYDYFCQACGFESEVFQKITADPMRVCPQCSKETFQRRPGGGIGLAFKGQGFYVTDSRGHQSNETSATPQNGGGGCCPCGKNKPSCSS